MRDCDEPNFGSDLGRDDPANLRCTFDKIKKQLTKRKEA
jgi:hypothetical protein